MADHGITQVPVFSAGECTGSVRESNLMAKAIEDRKALDAAVSTVMEGPYPVIHESDPIDHVLRLFTRHNDAVLVRTSGAISGILTRSDIIQHLVK
jgi:predicted transcriptional regulator